MAKYGLGLGLGALIPESNEENGIPAFSENDSDRKTLSESEKTAAQAVSKSQTERENFQKGFQSMKTASFGSM